jgi:hypothetical protein
MNTNDAEFEKQVIGFYCNSVAEQAPPLMPDGEGQYRYIGCFKENTPGRQLQSQLYGNDASTNAMCIEACNNREFTFCGTQYHRECWGGNLIPAQKVDEINCNFDCSGDIHQTCGGNGEGAGSGGTYISVFADSLTFDGNYTRPDGGNNGGGGGGGGGGAGPKPVANPGVNGYKHIGCHTEATTGRALTKQIGLEVATVENCVDACAAEDFLMAGVEYAGECFCGNTLRPGAVPAPAAECNLACSGNKTELCGGGSRLNVYQFDDGTIPTPTNGPEPTSSTTTSVSSGTPVPTSPSRTRRVGDYLLQGCWTEGTNVRALAGKTYARDDMTLNDCADFCDGFTYFGTEYGRECYCGNALGTGSVKAENQYDCSFTCAGNPLQYCGAGNRLELYKLEGATVSSSSSSVVSSRASTAEETTAEETTAEETTTPDFTDVAATSTRSSSTISSSTRSSSSSSASASPTGPIVDQGNSNFTFYSCVKEPSSGRLLTTQIFNDGDDMTIQACLERCWNYKWVGVEYGRECWCNREIRWAGNTGATPGKNVTDETCNFKCPGDKNVLCGGSSVMSLYTRKEDDDDE